MAVRHRVTRRLATAWCIFGVVLLTLFGVEGVLRLLFLTKDTFWDKPQELHVFDAPLGGDGSSAWLEAYEGEHLESARTEWHSYVYWRRQPYHGKYINVDAHGLRRTWTGAREEGRRLKVFVLGGSTIWGSGARDDFTIPSLIAKRLATGDVRADVVNLGESGYVSTQEVLTLLMELQQGNHPDAVVFYDGLNDTYSASQAGMAGSPQNEWKRSREYGLIDSPSRITGLFFRQLPGRFTGLNRLASQVRGWQLKRPTETGGANRHAENLADEVVRVYETNVRLVEALGQSYGFACLFYWQPTLFSKANPNSLERSLRQAASSRFGDALLLTRDRIQKSSALNTNPHFQDLSNIFDGDSDGVYVDLISHVNERGDGLIADVISRALIRQLSEKSRALPRAAHPAATDRVGR
jgi:lysophospholipase L1-like esterase